MNFDYKPQVPTYAQQKDLVKRKLATSSVHEGIETFKYAKKVMYNYLWDTDETLHECRGHSYDVETQELVVAAPRKSFNYLENGWWKDVSLDEEVLVQKKYNGFMGCVSCHDSKLVYSTTGSTKSEFAGWVKEETNAVDTHLWYRAFTALYEIVREEDPHIVHEEPGAHFLGVRCKATGMYTPDYSSVQFMQLRDVIELAKTSKYEGYMVWSTKDDFKLKPCKMKSDWYVGMKKLMRMPASKVDLMYSRKQIQGLPEIFKGFPEIIADLWTAEEWKSFTDQERRAELEDLYDNIRYSLDFVSP